MVISSASGTCFPLTDGRPSSGTPFSSTCAGSQWRGELVSVLVSVVAQRTQQQSAQGSSSASFTAEYLLRNF